jgi:predicted O-methyltransferase YrrM
LGCSSLIAEKILPRVFDYSQLNPSCHEVNSTWKTGQLAFNGAPEVGAFLTYLKKTYNITTAVETGTFLGNTTVFLSLLFDDVYTIEVVENTYQSTANQLKVFPNIQCLLGSSEKVLAELLPNLKEKRALFYLDAHWEKHWPLREELKEIAKTHYDNCVIMIDDFKVPGRKDIPFDKYKGNECSIDYIREELKLVFSDYEIHYIVPMRTASRAKFVAWPKKF